MEEKERAKSKEQHVARAGGNSNNQEPCEAAKATIDASETTLSIHKDRYPHTCPHLVADSPSLTARPHECG
eukprot:758670-Hanusia_phi.AAC.1